MMDKYILQKLNKRPIAYYPVYKDLTNSTPGGIMLSQLMYWFSKKEKFYKTDMQIMDETHLTTNELRAAKKLIKDLNFITITREGVPAKTYYKISWEQYEISLVELTKLDCAISLNSASEIHETITKTTTKKEREDFFSINEKAINLYIEHVMKIDNIRNKTAFKRTLIKKFMDDDKSTIQIFKEWKDEYNLNILKNQYISKHYNLTLIIKNPNEDIVIGKLENIRTINKNIRCSFIVINQKIPKKIEVNFLSFEKVNEFLIGIYNGQ